MTTKVFPDGIRNSACPWLASAVVASALVSPGCTKAAAAEPARRSSDLELTIYKQDFALVHDTRTVPVVTGSQQVRLAGVSKQLDPESVMFDWKSSGRPPAVVSTTYNVGVSSSQELLKQLVGQDVDVVWRGQDGKESDRESGRLEEAGQGTVLHTHDGYLIDPTGEVVVPENRAFATMPELIANVESPTSGSEDLCASYLTRGLSWNADYVASISPDGKSMRLECWGSVNNQTGTDFPGAKLKLVSGNPNRSLGFLHDDLRTTADATGMPKLAAARRPSWNLPAVAMGDLYTYTIPSKADIDQGQVNRVRIFEAGYVPISRTYSIALAPWVDPSQHRTAQVSISFTNATEAGLGMPLPEGAVRAYDAGSDPQDYLGAAELGDTPKGDRAALTLSDAFDVYAKSAQASVRRLGRHSISESFNSTVYNEKKSDAIVRVVQQFQGAVKVVSESNPSKPLAVDSREWRLQVPAGGRVRLDYTVVVKD